jgi:hypothetical protein
MADSASLRGRRWRAHRAGDHSLCGERCLNERVRAAERSDDEVELRQAPGVAAAVEAFIRETHYPASDPRCLSLAVAARLAKAIDRDPGNAAVARELSNIIRAIAVDPAAPADAIDELRAKRAARRVEMLLPS